MLRKLIHWLMRQRSYVWFMKRIAPKVRFSWEHTRIKGHQYRRGYRLLKPGHIILSSDEKRLTSLLTPGVVDHAALCVAVNDDVEILEMTQDGLVEGNFYNTCHTADHVVIIDCVDWDDDYKKAVIALCHDFKGTKYDFQFDLDNNDLYCSELIYRCDYEQRLQLKPLVTDFGTFVTPQVLLEASNIKIVWDSDVEF